MVLRYIFWAIVFLSLPPAQAQTTWHWKVGACSGSIVDYEEYLDWDEVKAWDIVEDRIRLSIRPAFGLTFDQPISPTCSFGGDFNLLSHSFPFEATYGGLGGGYNVRGRFNLLNAQTSGRFTLQAFDWLHFRLGLGAMLRLGDFSKADRGGYGQASGYTGAATAKNTFKGFLLMPVMGLVYPGSNGIGVELLAGHSLARFPQQATSGNLRGFLTTLQLSVLFKV